LGNESLKQGEMMKAQWQIVDIETGKTIRVGQPIELVDGVSEIFIDGSYLTGGEAKILFGEIDAIHEPLGVIKAAK
jgi:hypothetical protein